MRLCLDKGQSQAHPERARDTPPRVFAPADMGSVHVHSTLRTAFLPLPPLSLRSTARRAGLARQRPICRSGEKHRTHSVRQAVRRLAPVTTLCVSAAVLAMSTSGAFAAPVASAMSAMTDVAHQSLGERLAGWLTARGISDGATVLAVSAMPVVELRAGIPIGFMLGMNPLKVFVYAVVGNMIPVFLLLRLLRWEMVRRLAAPFLERARRKASAFGSGESIATALALFVGVPMPGTGAFTGCVVAFVLGLSERAAIVSIGAGVVMSACIMTILSAMGKAGAAIAMMAMLVAGFASILSSRRAAGRAHPLE